MEGCKLVDGLSFLEGLLPEIVLSFKAALTGVETCEEAEEVAYPAVEGVGF